MTTIFKKSSLHSNKSKRKVLENIAEDYKELLRLVAESKLPLDKKEKLADTVRFVLDIVDIEEERLAFERIQCTNKGQKKTTDKIL